MAVKKSTAGVEKEPVKEEASSAGFCVYIGPSVLGVIQNATIIAGSKEEALKDDAIAIALEKLPGIADLIVDGNALSASIIESKKPGTELYRKCKNLTKKNK